MSAGVAITGAGLVTAAGSSPESLHRALCQGLPLWRSDSRAPEGTAAAGGPLRAPIDGFDIKSFVQRRGLRDLSRTSQLACAAASPLAAALAGTPPGDIGVVLGSGWASLASIVDFEWETCTLPARLVNPLLFAETVANVPAGQVSILFGWSAFNLTVSSGPASGLEALREAALLLDEERAPLVVAGGADEVNLAALRVLRADGAAARTADSLPFGQGRNGPVGGEGACLLVLEPEGRARSRGARLLARLRASASGFAGPDAGGPQGSGPPAAAIAGLLRLLLERGGLRPGEVDLVTASACGSPAGDREEALALHEVFGGGPQAACVVAPKAVLGETWGASGPLAVLAVCEAMRTGVVPGRPRGFVPDPVLPPINLPPEPVSRAVRHAVVVARTDSGHLSASLLSAPEANDAG